MNDHEIDRLLRRSQPDDVAALLHEAGQELLEEIMSAPDHIDESTETFLEEVVSLPPWRRKRRRVRWLVGVAAALAAGLAITVPLTLLRGPGGVTPASGLPQEPLRSIGNPYLILDRLDWRMTHLYQQGSQDGEEAFTEASGGELQIHWYAADRYSSYLADREHAEKARPINLFGMVGDLFESGHQSFEVFLPPQGDSFVAIRGDGVDSRKDFFALLQDLHVLDEATWTASLPSAMVAPDESVEVARQMLSDVPLPDGTRVQQFRSEAALDYYQFGVTVMGPVACGWFADYERARADGDQERMAQIAKVFEGSRRWKVLRTMAENGAWPDSIWEWGDRVEQGLDVWGTRNDLGCKG